MHKPAHSAPDGISCWLQAALVIALFALALAVRLYDVTDLPLDFHPTRQLLSEIKARGMFLQQDETAPAWQRTLAIRQWNQRAEVEPEVFERLVAYTYRYTGIQIWVARAYAAIFWLVAALFLFLLVRHLSSVVPAIVSTSYFLFLPYGIFASRSFQPDLLMMPLLLGSWYALAQWSARPSWFKAISVGIVGGLAIYVKFVAAFFILGPALGLSITMYGAGLFRRLQIWVMALLGVLPASIYLYYGMVQHSFLGRQFEGRFIPALLLDPLNYVEWAALANVAAGALAIAVGIVGIVVACERRVRALLFGLWIAYGLFGLFFDYHVATHDYYHLPLIALVALSMAPLVELAWSSMMGVSGIRTLRVVGVSALLYTVFSISWGIRQDLKQVDYRPQAVMWQGIGDILGHADGVTALTQDYGSRLAYWGWQNAAIWPYTGDLTYHAQRGSSRGFNSLFNQLASGQSYFLVTDFDELARQSDLATRLSTYKIFSQGEGYVIYDLRRAAP